MTSQLHVFHYLCVAALSGIITAVYKFTEKSELDTLNRLFFPSAPAQGARDHIISTSGANSGRQSIWVHIKKSIN